MSGENKMTFAMFKYKLGSRLRGSSATFRGFIGGMINGVYGAYGQTEPPMPFDIYARLSYALVQNVVQRIH